MASNPGGGLFSSPLLIPQKVFNPITLLVFGIFTFAVSWIGYDMVIPGMPALTEEFAISDSMGNLNLFVFLIAMAVSTLLSGTISDALGRKPVLLAGAIMMFAGALVSAMAPNYWVLLAARIPHGIGSGIASVLLGTVVTDSYEGEAFDKAMTLMQSMGILGPVAAPFLGSLLLSVFSWRAVFVALAVLSGVILLGVISLSETLPAEQRTVVNWSQTFASMVDVCRAPGFFGVCVAVSVMAMPMMAFLAVSSYILLDQFGITYLEYSVVYAVAAGSGIVSPLVYLWVVDRGVTEGFMAKFCIAGLALSGVLALTVGSWSALLLLVAVLPAFVVEGIFRSQGFVAMLENRDEARGAANSVAGFAYSVVSSAGTVLVTAMGTAYVLNVGWMSIAAVVVVTGIWITLSIRKTLLPKYLK